jgi:uncharacterized Zn finger protein
VAQIEVTEDSVREQVDSEVFARAERLAGGVSGLTVTGTLIAAVVDGVTVAARVGPAGLDGTCACPDPVPCAHAVSAVLAWVRSSAGEASAGDTGAADWEEASLLAEVEDALADGELDVDFLDELVDDIEDLLDEDPAAVRDLADRVMNLLEARDDAGLTDLLERVEELWLEARQVAGPAGPKVVLPGKPSYAETRARRLSLSEPMVASTALGS